MAVMQLPLCDPPACEHRNIQIEDGNSKRCADCGAWLSSKAISEHRKEVGIALVMSHQTEEWKTQALGSVYRVARRFREFTVNEVRDQILMDGVGDPSNLNAWGGLFHAIKAKKIAMPTDRTEQTRHPEGHGRSVRVWRSCL